MRSFFFSTLGGGGDFGVFMKFLLDIHDVPVGWDGGASMFCVLPFCIRVAFKCERQE